MTKIHKRIERRASGWFWCVTINGHPSRFGIANTKEEAMLLVGGLVLHG